MKNTLKILGIIALIAVVMFSAAACKKDKAAPEANGWETAISEYENIVNEMIPLIEKAQEGDATAEDALTGLTQKMLTLQGTFTTLDRSTLTEAQQLRVAEIQEKFFTILSSMMNQEMDQ